MDSKFIPQEHETEIYEFWEKNGYFKADVHTKKEPFTIVLPPPNANGSLHMGHAMYVYEDIMIRYHTLKGYESLWIPGADHAGFETQVVFEKYLDKKGQSRFDFSREELYEMIYDFVQENRSTMENQLRSLGFALDWEKAQFTLDPAIVKIVNTTFTKLFNDGLVYKANRLVNYCVKHGTSFSDLEVDYEERTDKIYSIQYKIKEGGSIIVATTRPETLFGDTAVAVHPTDKRYKNLIGKTVILPFIHREIPIISDEEIDKKFGTGAVKITPAHDPADYEMGKRHHLSEISVIETNGRLNKEAGEYAGLKIKAAREKVVEDLKTNGMLVEEKEHIHRVGVCYKCRTPIEPLLSDQWFIKMQPLVAPAIKAIEDGEVTFVPTRYKKIALDWLRKFHDWNISRQIVWGIQIPIWYCQKCNKTIVSEEKPACECAGDVIQEKDTFDTWFSSSQWPFATLQHISEQTGKPYFDTFYPISVMETGYDILPWWVIRMLIMGIYITGKVPFKTVFLHGMVRDGKGQKMSKSKGNVINPMDAVKKYGADALRAALIFQTKEGENVPFVEDKVLGMRNFGNKVWNMGRFIQMTQPTQTKQTSENETLLLELEKEFAKEKKKIMKYMDQYKFSYAFNELYEFMWHRFADYYIEQLKDDIKNGNIRVHDVLEKVYLESLVLLHPFMPFITEAVGQTFKGKKSSILTNLL